MTPERFRLVAVCCAFLAVLSNTPPAAAQDISRFECKVGAGETNEGMIQAALVEAESPDLQKRAADCVLAHPDIVDPIALAFVAQSLWTRGDRLQAAFWLYMFQARTRPWAKGDATYRQAQGALNSMIGGRINLWLGSDQAAFHDVAERSISYEKRAPMYAGRPKNQSAEAWASLVAQERQAWEAQYRAMASGALKPEVVEAGRRERGLPVGPLDKPGAALPDAWR